MRPRMGPVLALACVLVLLAAGTAIAADQTVDVNVLPNDVLSVEVNDQIWLGTEVGTTSDWAEFDMHITNTTSSGWLVSVSGTDLLGYYHDEPCDEFGCTMYYTGIDLPPTALTVAGGDFVEWGWGDPEGAITPSTVTVDYTDAALVAGTADAYGQFTLDNPWSRMQITVPADPAPGDGTYAGQYQGTVTYTITANP